jgi:hypothetical protein
MRARIALISAFLVIAVAPLMADDAAKASVFAFKARDVKATLDDVDSFHKTPEDALAIIEKMPSSLRLVNASKGDVVWIYCFFLPESGKDIVLKIDEKPRRTLIEQQFQTLVKLAQKVAGAAAANIKVDRFQYILQLDRATVTVAPTIGTPTAKASPPDKEPQWIVVVDYTNAGQATSNLADNSADVLTGRREAWYFSADVPLSKLGDVKVDDQFKNIDLSNTPADFYVGLNFAPRGDALESPRTFAEAVTIKGLLKASRKPSDSIGVGFGLRSGYFSASPTLRRFTVLQILDTVSPYVAYTRTRVRQEQKDAAGNVTSTLHFIRSDWTFGLSLDLDKALDFLKK